MAGLNHDFLVIDSDTFSLNHYSKYNTADKVQFHDDFIMYINDSLLWVETKNPFDEKSQQGLCINGPTLIEQKNTVQFEKILYAWSILFMTAPDQIQLRGLFTWIDGNSRQEGDYDRILLKKKPLIESLNKLIKFCQNVTESEGQKTLLHLGI